MNLLRVIFLLFIAAFIVSACKAVEENPPSVKKLGNTVNQSGLFIDLPDPETPEASEHAIRNRVVGIDFEALSLELVSGQVLSLHLNFFEDAFFQALRKKQTLNASGSITWLGDIPSKPGSIVIFVATKQQLEGSADIPGIGSFTVRKISKGRYLIEEIRPGSIQ